MDRTHTIVWFRRDLRVEDNPALAAAARAGSVIPVFIWSPEEEGHFLPGRVSRWWLKQSLLHLDQSLRSLGAPMIFRRAKDALSVLLAISKESRATQVFYNHLYDPVSLVRDHRVKQGLLQSGILVQSFNADLLYEPWEVQDGEGRPFTTFAAFWERCLNMPIEPEAPLLPPRRLFPFPGQIFSCVVEDLALEDESEKGSNALLARVWSPGWINADRALGSFVNGPLLDYAVNRQKTDGPTTSLLSPHLHYGELSVRKIFHHVRMKQVLWAKEGRLNGERSVSLFLRSIGFREYSRYLSFNFPFTHERALLSHLKAFPWRVDGSYFKAWRQGRTGYPLVDAGMREIWATGWLHNRIRVIVSSFFVKFLQLPWKWGMKYFWDTLLDADLESDILGWQYISGSLPDGHELDRMDSPQIEGYRFDPQGEYVRRWLPELSRLPTDWIHHPWDAPPAVLCAAGIELGSNYPRPIVEIPAARARLELAIAMMWEADTAHKASFANGSEEGLGDTIEFCGNNNVAMEIARAPLDRNRGEFSGRSIHDQMVPNMPVDVGRVGVPIASEEGQRQANQLHCQPLSRIVPGLSNVCIVEGSRQIQGQRLLLPSAIEQGEANDTVSTAESSSVQDRNRIISGPCGQGASGQTQRFQEEGQIPTVPDIHRGVLSRRHLHGLPMVNLEALAATKASSLSA
eukprot:c28427_g1_i1 orf=1839-3896(-)